MSLRTESNSPAGVQILSQVGSVLVVVGIVVVGFYGAHWLLPDERHDALPDAELAPAVEMKAGHRATVKLPAEKLAAAGIQSHMVEERGIEPTVTVPGTVRYDATRHLAVRAPVECVVEDVRVAHGEWVEQGVALVSLTSTEVGLAKSEVKKCEADLKFARLEQEWADETDGNVEELLAFLETQPEIADVESRFEQKLLGEHRNELISAYSQLLLATKAVDRAKSLTGDGIVSGSTAAQRESAREIAAANFKGVCEELRFDVRHDREKAKAQVEAAERMLEVCRERLDVLLGPHGSREFGRDPDGAGEGSRFELVASGEGRIEELLAVRGARFDAGEEMLTIADTRRLWVAAQVHQRDWNALAAKPGQDVSVSGPALLGRTLTATVRFAGATVSPATLSVPLVCELENTDDLLRPGMFVWVEIPVGPPRRAIAVPASAVQRHEGQAFVFVQTSEGAYERVDVTLGNERPEWIEVTEGVKQGDPVVAEGAFFLKSELLLEAEE
jgi:cobalt-zinc-cadmium efflux system membrane fusion protein